MEKINCIKTNFNIKNLNIKQGKKPVLLPASIVISKQVM